MLTKDIIPITEDAIPTILAFDNEQMTHVVGNKARLTGLKGKTTVFNFKPDLGKGDAEFSKNKKYWCYLAPTSKHDKIIETYTAKDASIIYLKELLKDTDLPEQILIGEPAVREKAWKENFRRHIREIFKEVDPKVQPQFFPEPFAVFQFYRNLLFPKTSKSEIVLVIDIGGGTFNSCIIKTTDEGYLSRGGGTNVPLGLQAEACGGCEIDKGILQIVINNAKKMGVLWKDDPLLRSESSETPIMLHIEDAKIQLSEFIDSSARLADDLSGIKIKLSLERGILHPDTEITVDLTGEDLKGVIRKMWRKEYGNIIVKTINEAKAQLNRMNMKFEKIDKVIVAGGSSKLPFMKEEITTVLPTLVSRSDIYLAPSHHLGGSVAFGLAIECLEQIKRNPKLSVGKFAPCLLNELYLGFRRSRSHPILTPKIKSNGESLKYGQLIAEPFIIEDFTLNYEFQMPFEVSDRVFYCFADRPFKDNEEIIPLNINQDIFSLRTDKKIIRKWRLQIKIHKNGMIKPTFIYKEKGMGAQKEGVKIPVPEFNLPNFTLKEGNTYLGVDFGTSNSYVVRFIKPSEISEDIQYPDFDINPGTLEKLRHLESVILTLRESAIFDDDKIKDYSKHQMLLLVFHSNKIEGNPLTKGETEKILKKEDIDGFTKSEREAFNLENAYKWMIENYDACTKEPEGFIRTVNKMILEGVAKGGGEYRMQPVEISGMDFKPPMGSLIPAFMAKLSKEIKGGGKDRSALEFATSIHTKLVAIHPFIDGNGRTARLLLNAILLKNELPPLIVNFADKQRYLTALSSSNKGDISPLIEFLIECFYESTEEYKGWISRSDEIDSEMSELSDITLEIDIFKKTEDTILTPIEEVDLKSADDPLKAVMHSKIHQIEKNIRTNYNIWQTCIEEFKSKFIFIINEFNSNQDYRSAGFYIKLREYDILPFEKYQDICLGKKVTKTWFLGITLFGPNSKENLLFFFVPRTERAKNIKRVIPVSLVLARDDGVSYRVLESEPISLREVAVSDSKIISFQSDGGHKIGNIQMIQKTLLAEVIKSYLFIEKKQ